MTVLPWREHPAARAELRDAAFWYDDRGSGLGKRLANEVAADLALIRKWPDAAPRYRGRGNHSGLRSKNLDIFPYRIIYFVRDAEVVVVA